MVAEPPPASASRALLIAHHDAIERLIWAYEHAPRDARVTRAALIQRLGEELEAHIAIAAACGAAVPHAHRLLSLTADLGGAPPDGPLFTAGAAALVAEVRAQLGRERDLAAPQT